jgi:hypothetical protein
MSGIRMLFALVMLALAALPTQATAQSANGAHIFDVINAAENVWDETLNACSSTYIPNATLLDECHAYANDIFNTFEAWWTEYNNNTLTVAYDQQVEQLLQGYEADLQNVLQEAGYTYTPSDDSASAAPLELAPDDLDSAAASSNCSQCVAALKQILIFCGASAVVTRSVPVTLVCLLIGAGTFLTCDYISCPAPPAAPKSCS